MSVYSFTAVSKKGESYSEKREAKDESELAQILRQEGYVLISAVSERAKKRKIVSLLSVFHSIGLQPVSLTEKIMFTRNFQVMVGAGISLPRSFKILSEQTENKKFKNILNKTAEEITKGKILSDSLALYPRVFSEFFVNMIRVGEESGTLEKVLGNLISQMEKEYELKSKVKGAMIYPAIIILAMLGIGILMLVTVVPSLAATFEDLGVELPFATKMIINLAAFLSEKWYLLVLCAFGLGLLSRLILKTQKGGKTMDSFILKIPVVAPIAKKTNTASIVRILGSLIDSGVPIVRSLEIISRTLGNFYFKQSLIEAAKKVEKGEKLSTSLKPYHNLYPPLVSQMIEIGEETGETSVILSKLADFFEQEVSNATKNLSAVIEPVLMLVIGAAVGFFAVSMIQPMYSMLGTI